MASIAISPATFPINSTVLMTVTGTSTTFTTGSTFTTTMTGLTFGPTIFGSTTSLTVLVTTGPVVGSGTITESTSASSANVATESVAAYIASGNSPTSTQNNLTSVGTYAGPIVFSEIFKGGVGVVEVLNGNLVAIAR
jgi:hypothetical protein